MYVLMTLSSATPEDTLRQRLREASNAKSHEPSSIIECSPAEATASEKMTCFEGAVFPDMMTRTLQALIDGPMGRSESEVDAQACPTHLCEPANCPGNRCSSPIPAQQILTPLLLQA